MFEVLRIYLMPLERKTNYCRLSSPRKLGGISNRNLTRVKVIKVIKLINIQQSQFMMEQFTMLKGIVLRPRPWRQGHLFHQPSEFKGLQEKDRLKGEPPKSLEELPTSYPTTIPQIICSASCTVSRKAPKRGLGETWQVFTPGVR